MGVIGSVEGRGPNESPRTKRTRRLQKQVDNRERGREAGTMTGAQENHFKQSPRNKKREKKRGKNKGPTIKWETICGSSISSGTISPRARGGEVPVRRREGRNSHVILGRQWRTATVTAAPPLERALFTGRLSPPASSRANGRSAGRVRREPPADAALLS